VLVERHAHLAICGPQLRGELELEPIGAADGLVEVAQHVAAEAQALHERLGGIGRLRAHGEERRA
jgi:hypothetical protein